MIADEFTQLVFHVLAHVPLPGPGSVFDPRYVAWLAGRFAQDDRSRLREDAELLARVWAGDPRHDRLHGICELHRGGPGFWPTTDRSLAQLDDDEVADAALLDRLRPLVGAELLHATLSLIAPEFRRVFAELRPELERADAEVRRWIDRLARRCPGLADARVELVWALGLHGRGFERRILVGAPADWNGCSAARQAVLAAHERLVLCVESDDYATQEWTALRQLAIRLDGAEAPLRDAHRDWLAGLDLRPLLAELCARGLVDPREAEALLAEPAARAARLSAAPAGGSS